MDGWVDNWMDEWVAGRLFNKLQKLKKSADRMGGWVDGVKVVIRIAYINKKSKFS